MGEDDLVKNKVRLCLGSVLTLAGTMILCTVYLGMAIYIPNMTGWSTPPGKFMSALMDTGGIAFGITGLVVVGVGLMILYNEYCDNK
jgi:hypothetical protein